MASPAALAETLAGPSTAELESDWNYFGLYFQAEKDVRLVSVRFLNAGQADTVELRSGLNGPVLVTVSTPPGSTNQTLTIDYDLVAGGDYALVATTPNNRTYADFNAYPHGNAHISVLSGAGCLDGPGCEITTQGHFWATFMDLVTSACSSGPATGCLSAGNSSLLVKDSAKDGKDLVKWAWKKGAAFDQADLPDPLAGNYALCIYDSIASQPALFASYEATKYEELWTDKAAKGRSYQDKIGYGMGLTKLQFKTGAEGKSSVGASVGGGIVSLPAAVGDTYFHAEQSVVVQVINSAGTCWQASYGASETKKHDAATFKAVEK